MSSDNEELPGFVRDPETGRYFRNGSGPSSNRTLERLRTERIERERNNEYESKPKVTNIVHYLNTRELRSEDGSQDSREILKMRWHSKTLIEDKSKKVNKLFRGIDFDDVFFIKGSKDYIYGTWYNAAHRAYVIGHMEANEDPEDDMYFQQSFGYVIDMCESLRQGFVVVYNECRPDFEDLHVEHVNKYDRSFLFQLGATFAGKPLDYFKRSILCCSCSKKGSYYAFGCENAVAFIHTGNEESYLNVKGRVHTVSLDDTGNLMFAGVHTGKLSLHDLRIKKMVMDVEVSDFCLVDSLLLNSNQIIISGTENVLCNVDIRKKAVITEYFYHKKQGVKKEPLSVDNNILCALGSDNRVRIWDVLGGFPVYEILPQNPGKKIKGCLHSEGRKMYYNHFEADERKVFEI